MGLIDLDDPESNESYLTMAELSGENADDSGKLSSEESCSASDGDSEDEVVGSTKREANWGN